MRPRAHPARDNTPSPWRLALKGNSATPSSSRDCGVHSPATSSHYCPRTPPCSPSDKESSKSPLLQGAHPRSPVDLLRLTGGASGQFPIITARESRQQISGSGCSTVETGFVSYQVSKCRESPKFRRSDGGCACVYGGGRADHHVYKPHPTF